MAYATIVDLVNYLNGEDPPPGAERLLVRASEVIDDLLIGAVYPVDDDGMPTKPAHVDAFKRAACAQTQFMGAATKAGEDETGWSSRYTSVAVGSVSYSRAASPAAPGQTVIPEAASQAVSVLRTAGLLPVSAYNFRYTSRP